MTEKESGGRKRSPSKRESASTDAGRNGHDRAAARYERELAKYLERRIKPGLNSGSIPLLARSIAKTEAENYERELTEYLQERIKPGLNRGAIPMLARSLAREIAQREQFDVPAAGADADDQPMDAEDFEAEMHALQRELGDQWVVRFSVCGGDAWLTAETTDSTQRVEATTADVLVKAVALLDRDGGRGS